MKNEIFKMKNEKIKLEMNEKKTKNPNGKNENSRGREEKETRLRANKIQTIDSGALTKTNQIHDSFVRFLKKCFQIFYFFLSFFFLIFIIFFVKSFYIENKC